MPYNDNSSQIPYVSNPYDQRTAAGGSLIPTSLGATVSASGPKKGPVQQQATRINQALALCEENFAALEGRLQLALGPEPNNKPSGGQPSGAVRETTSGMSELGREMESQADRIFMLGAKIQMLMGRVEL